MQMTMDYGMQDRGRPPAPQARHAGAGHGDGVTPPPPMTFAGVRSSNPILASGQTIFRFIPMNVLRNRKTVSV